MLETVLELIENAMGPFLFAVAFMALTSVMSGQSAYLQAGTDEYLEDAVYSQKNSHYEPDETVSFDELVATLVATPSVDMDVKVFNCPSMNPRTFTFSIKVLGDGSLRVKKQYYFADSLYETDYGILYNFQSFDFTEFPSGDYMKEFEYVDGQLSNVVYSIRF